MARTPWIGLAALVAMFLIPFLPTWLFEGPRIVKHRPRRHICGDCGERWIDGHDCTPASEAGAPLRGQLRRLKPPGEQVRAPRMSPRARKGLSRMS
jgi:hypothetical protein